MNKEILKYLPTHIDESDLQWSGNIDNKDVAVFFDNSEYSVFSTEGYHGTMELGFTMSELLHVAKHKPIPYILIRI